MRTLRNIGIGVLVSATMLAYGCKEKQNMKTFNLPNGASVTGWYVNAKNPGEGFYSKDDVGEASRLEGKIIHMDLPNVYKGTIPDLSAQGIQAALKDKALGMDKLVEYVVIVIDPTVDNQVNRTVYVKSGGGLPPTAVFDLFQEGSMVRPQTVNAKLDDKRNPIYTNKGDMDNEAFVLTPEDLLRSNQEILSFALREPPKKATPQFLKIPTIEYKKTTHNEQQ